MKMGDRYFYIWWHPSEDKDSILVTDDYWNGQYQDYANKILGNIFLTASDALKHKQEVYDRIMSMYKVLEDKDEKCV